MSVPEGQDTAAVPTPSGRLVVIVGPSGSGKDTLIAWLRVRLADRPDVRFVRRTVTRIPDTHLEDHDMMSPAEFAQAEADGRFAVTWQAHGLHYALPASARDHVKASGIAIANGSRGALGEIEKAFGKVLVIHLSVDPDILRRRLEKRGRENASEITERLDRAAAGERKPAGHIVDNSGPIEVAGLAVLDLIDNYC